mmetsp:Transcript_9082/g.11172  ORF Transcript_9082/g.11172 Transcript_9082/m.11172 type:complete len:597 (-) Transcript_9082:115-1905(-)
MKKIRRAAGRYEKDEAKRKYRDNAPELTLHHLVKERYPRFVDALEDLDDALALVHLFAALPSQGRILVKTTTKAKELAAAWGAYCASAHCVTKSFISVKGVYFEAVVMGSTTVRWVQPHNFTQYMPKDVDYRVMVTFFDFYEVLLGFVLFKLYSDVGVRYPFTNTERDDGRSSTVLAAHLKALRRDRRTAKNAVMEAIAAPPTDNQTENNDDGDDGKKDNENTPAETKANKKKTEELFSTINTALEKVKDDVNDDPKTLDSDDETDAMDISAPLKAALESMAEEEDAATSHDLKTRLDDGAAKRKALFAKLTFFLSREIPRGYLELVILSFGGKVGWEGDDSPIHATDPSVTHHVVDRPKLPDSLKSLPKSREFVQPQWIVDCANFMYLLPVKKYAVGRELPPHLSPWVNDDEEGYKPRYKEEVEKLISGEIDADAVDVEESEDEGVDAVTAVDKKVSKDGDESSSDEDSSDDEEEEEQDEIEVEKKQEQKRKKAEDEAKDLAKLMMSKKAKRLYGRMQHGLAEKRAAVDVLQKKREDIEQSKKKDDVTGKSYNKMKVERLKEKRKDIEKLYEKSAASAKKKKSKRRKTKGVVGNE